MSSTSYGMSKGQPVDLARKKEVFIMPKAQVGMSVLWYPYGESDGVGVPALVNAVGERTLSLHIFLNMRTNLMYKDGVRHKDDPEAKREEYIDSGSWHYSSPTQDMLQMKADLERLRSAIETRKTT